MQMWRSLQFRLYAALGMVALLLFIQIIVGLQTSATLNRVQRNIEAVSQERISAYLFTALAHQIQAAKTPEQKEQATALLEVQIDRSNQIQEALQSREGSLRQQSTSPENELMFAKIEAAWQTYKVLLESFMVLDNTEQATLLPEIEHQSTLYFQSTTELADSLAMVRARYVQSSRLQLNILSGLVIVGLAVAGFIVHRTVVALAQLRNTATEFAGGNLNVRAKTNTVHEIATVGTVLNSMAERLGSTISELQCSAHLADQARSEAEYANKAKTAFLTGISHELRTPLHAIINLTHFVAEGDVGAINSQQAELLKDVTGSANHLLALINDILDMSKIESGSLTLLIEEHVNLQEIVEKVVALGEGLLGGSAVEIRAEIDPHLPLIRADRQRVLQILLNIMSNACKFTVKGMVEVRAHQLNSDEVIITIRDTGTGIAVREQPLVFEPFKQSESGIKRGGTGLGMPISKNLAEAHGGRVWLESEVGKGTTFFVTLPIQSEQLRPLLLS